jgi:hypothetical protein
MVKCASNLGQEAEGMMCPGLEGCAMRTRDSLPSTSIRAGGQCAGDHTFGKEIPAIANRLARHDSWHAMHRFRADRTTTPAMAIARDVALHSAYLGAGWSSRCIKWAGAGDVCEEHGQLGRWGGGRAASPIELQPRPGAEPCPPAAQRRVPHDARPDGCCWF